MAVLVIISDFFKKSQDFVTARAIAMFPENIRTLKRIKYFFSLFKKCMSKMNEIYVPINAWTGKQSKCLNKLTHLARSIDFVS